MIILPISNQYHVQPNNDDAILKLLSDYFPGGIGTLAYLVLVLRDDVRDFINDAIIMLLESYALIEDDSLADYVYQKINDLCGSEEFQMWLLRFHNTHAPVYDEHLQNVDIDSCVQHRDHNTKLYIQLNP